MLKIFERYKQAIKKHWPSCLALSAILIISIIFKESILFGVSDVISSIAIGLAFFASASFLIVESKKESPLFYVYAVAVSAFLALLAYVTNYSNNFMMSVSSLSTIVFIFGVYFNYKNSNLDFSDYLNNVIAANISYSIVVTLIGLEIAIIFSLSKYLLDFPLDFIPLDYIVAIALPPVVFAPFVNHNVSKVITKITTYVLSPALIIFYIITYLYVLKGLGDGTLSSSKILFMILGVFISTFTIYFITKKDTSSICKITSKLNYMFIPLLLVQVSTLLGRISTLGLNESRYIYIYLLIFEAFFIVNEVLKKDAMIYFIVLSTSLLILFVLPFVNVTYFPYWTQSIKLKSFNINDKVNDRYLEAYKILYDKCYTEGELCPINIVDSKVIDKLEEYSYKKNGYYISHDYNPDYYNNNYNNYEYPQRKHIHSCYNLETDTYEECYTYY